MGSGVGHSVRFKGQSKAQVMRRASANGTMSGHRLDRERSSLRADPWLLASSFSSPVKSSLKLLTNWALVILPETIKSGKRLTNYRATGFDHVVDGSEQVHGVMRCGVICDIQGW